MKIMISQPMYFPWVGFIEQLALADVFVIYDDVQFSKGSFTNRVQIKSENGIKWLTVPLAGVKLGDRINEIQVCEKREWRLAHQQLLQQTYRKSPYVLEMLGVLETALCQAGNRLDELAYLSTLVLADYFGVGNNCRIVRSSELGIFGEGSSRVLKIVKTLGGKTYITGHGARNYLNHPEFESEGISVEYMDYKCLPYSQLYGQFTPYVSALDLIANCGKAGAEQIKPRTKHWKEFVVGER